MAKRELSVTLKNLKFMQRAAPKEEKPKKEEEAKPDGNFVPPSNVSRKCMVIMEGDPRPGTIRGRMSFQNFNPSIDKLSDEAGNDHEAEAEASTSSIFQSGRKVERGNGVSERSGMDMDNGDGEDKRKQPETAAQTSHLKKKQKKDPDCMQPSPSENHNSKKQSKRDKLDWKVLMQKKTKGKRQGD